MELLGPINIIFRASYHMMLVDGGQNGGAGKRGGISEGGWRAGLEATRTAGRIEVGRRDK